MIKIERSYAIIYIDYNGESLTVDDFTTYNLTNDYYNNGGFLQWNFYLIIPEELIGNVSKKEIEINEKYTRKFIIKLNEIDKFIEDRFPITNVNMGKITLIKGDNWEDACKKADELEENGNFTLCLPSAYRNVSLTDAITGMDILRSFLINNPKMNVLFYTHLSNEYFLATKKFHLFLN